MCDRISHVFLQEKTRVKLGTVGVKRRACLVKGALCAAADPGLNSMTMGSLVQVCGSRFCFVFRFTN